MIAQMLYAGHETTRNLIGNGLFCLLENPGQLERLRSNPSLVEGAVEEMLRFEPPIIFLSRVVRRSCKLAGVEFEAGSLMHVSLSSANRDPNVCRNRLKHVPFGVVISAASNALSILRVST